jgi:3-oxoacyl-[acyl-carrier-protein] synthase-3
MTVVGLRAGTRSGGARVAGTGAAQPAGVVSGAELAEPFGKDADWLRTRTGITQLRRLSGDEDLLGLTLRAAQDAVGDAGLDRTEIDAVLVATCSGSPAGAPALSARLAARLAPRAVAFDVNSACAGFCYALSTAEAMIAMGSARTVLVVGAEQMSTLIDPADLGTSILFADGAGAVVVVAAPDGKRGIGPAAWSSDGSQSDLLVIPAGERHLRMNGRSVFRWAVEEVHKVARTACDRAGLTMADIEVFVPHQANLRIIDAVARALGLDHAVTATDVELSGNTSAASIPIALHRLRRSGRATSGQVALLAGFGAGLTIAAQVIRLP